MYICEVKSHDTTSIYFIITYIQIKKPMKKLFLLMMCCTALFTACNSDDDEKDDNGNGNGNNNEEPQPLPPPVVPHRLVKYIEYSSVANSNKDAEYTEYDDSYVKEFFYNEEYQVARIETNYANEYESDNTMSFDWSVKGEVNITSQDQDYYEPELYKAILNEKGNVTMLKEKGYEGYRDYLSFSYDEDGRLTRIEDEDDEYDGGSNLFTYKNGMLVKYQYVSFNNDYDDENITIEWDLAKAYANKIMNNRQIDMMGFFMADDDYDFLFHIGCAGRSSLYMLEEYPLGDEDGATHSISRYHTPNQTIHHSHLTIRYPEDSMATISYESTVENLLTKVAAKIPYEVWKVEYDIVVGNTLIDPDYPEMGYVADGIENRQETKQKTGYDYETYTIKYLGDDF